MKLNYKDQKERFLAIAELIRNAGSIYSTGVLHNDVYILEKIKEIEKNGDVIRNELNAHFILQQDIPYLALDRAKLLRKLDDTLDAYLIATNTYVLYHGSLPASFAANIASSVDNLLQINNLVVTGIVTIFDDFKATIEYTNKIEILRDEFIDNGNILEQQYFSSEENWKEYTAISKILKANIRCVNAMKVVSEILAQMAYTYM